MPQHSTFHAAINTILSRSSDQSHDSFKSYNLIERNESFLKTSYKARGRRGGKVSVVKKKGKKEKENWSTRGHHRSIFTQHRNSD